MKWVWELKAMINQNWTWVSWFNLDLQLETLYVWALVLNSFCVLFMAEKMCSRDPVKGFFSSNQVVLISFESTYSFMHEKWFKIFTFCSNYELLLRCYYDAPYMHTTKMEIFLLPSSKKFCLFQALALSGPTTLCP